MLPRPTIEAFDRHLATLGLRLEGVVIGGAALALLEIISRETRDFDMLAPALSREIAAAACDFAQRQRSLGIELADNWLNNGPLQLGEVLPAGWQGRIQLVFEGTALLLNTLGKSDLLKTKLFALCDRGTDIIDCIAMAPTAEEIAAAQPWLALQDANPEWPAHVTATLEALQRRIGHGL